MVWVQASLSRPDSALGLQDLFSPTVQQQQQQQGLSMFSAQSHPPLSPSFDLESPRTSFKGDTLASPNFSYRASSAHLQASCSPGIASPALHVLAPAYPWSPLRLHCVCAKDVTLQKITSERSFFSCALVERLLSSNKVCLGCTTSWTSRSWKMSSQSTAALTLEAEQRIPVDLQGFNSVPQSPSAAEAELAMWHLATRMGSLGMQQPPPPPQPQQQSPQPSPFAGAVRDPWGRTTDEQMAASLFSNGSGGGVFGLQHCESAPAGLFQDELRQLRKLGLTETLGLVRPSSFPRDASSLFFLFGNGTHLHVPCMALVCPACF